MLLACNGLLDTWFSCDVFETTSEQLVGDKGECRVRMWTGRKQILK